MEGGRERRGEVLFTRMVRCVLETGKICEVVKRICEIWGVGIKPLERKS